MQHEPYESNDSLEIIYVYTRAQALEDGVLIDVSDTAREAGFKCPVALTSAAYADCVEWTEVNPPLITKTRKAGCGMF